ncbi:hypothetical protein DMB65_20740 [Flavobacterium cheongpyeongense]|uniref:Uncharacterized protein n=1 Tax=Flavobacterium cheongpyeongense TaxID=2212651 RepID=A0A2V4BMM6_9FLAO|nr:hypothetical protein DMB65_20740 [Flavobacterium cheongpyeongense]
MKPILNGTSEISSYGVIVKQSGGFPEDVDSSFFCGEIRKNSVHHRAYAGKYALALFFRVYTTPFKAFYHSFLGCAPNLLFTVSCFL